MTWNLPDTRPLPKHRATQAQNKYMHISMPRVGSEPTTSVSEWAKTVDASDRAVNVTAPRRVIWASKSQHVPYETYRRFDAFSSACAALKGVHVRMKQIAQVTHNSGESVERHENLADPEPDAEQRQTLNCDI
jgi:hypothetical protein